MQFNWIIFCVHSATVSSLCCSAPHQYAKNLNKSWLLQHTRWKNLTNTEWAVSHGDTLNKRVILKTFCEDVIFCFEFEEKKIITSVFLRIMFSKLFLSLYCIWIKQIVKHSILTQAADLLIQKKKNRGATETLILLRQHKDNQVWQVTYQSPRETPQVNMCKDHMCATNSDQRACTESHQWVLDSLFTVLLSPWNRIILHFFKDSRTVVKYMKLTLPLGKSLCYN